MTDSFYEPPVFPERQASNWFRFIIDYNPCFLLSAVCMLVGCRLLNDAINLHPGDVHGALWLILTINVYEFCLLSVASLIRRVQGMRRDVGILLVVGSMFLCDITFVVGDLSIARPGIGLLIMLILVELAAIKTRIALRILGSPRQWQTVAIVVYIFAVTLFLPIEFKRISEHHDGYLPPLAIYAGWWLAGTLPIFARLILNARTDERLPGLARALMVIPYIALLGHLLACTWVFKLPFYVACYSPVLLGLAVVVGMSRVSLSRPVAIACQWTLAAAAVALAIGSPAELVYHGNINLWSAISALRLTLIAAALVNLYGWLVFQSVLFAGTLVLMSGVALAGTTLQMAITNMRMLFADLCDLYKRGIPRTPSQWGVVTVGASFVLLAIGAAVSLKPSPLRKTIKVI